MPTPDIDGPITPTPTDPLMIIVAGLVLILAMALLLQFTVRGLSSDPKEPAMTAPNQHDAPYGMTANDRPIPGGFTGTIPAFLDWLKEELACGGVRISEPVPSEFDANRLVRRVELITGGYSDDEALCGRVANGSLFGLSFWESSHRGGLTVYEVPVSRFDSDEEIAWLEPPTDVFEEVHRARELVVRTAQGDEISITLPYGAKLRFSEAGPDGGPRRLRDPAGVLTVEAIAAEDSPWAG